MRGTCWHHVVYMLWIMLDHSWSMLQKLAFCNKFSLKGMIQQAYCSVQARVPKYALLWLAQQYVPATKQEESINPLVKKTISSVNESSSTSAGQSFNHSISKLTDVPTSQGVKQTIASPRASEDGVMLGTVCQHMTAWSMLIYFVMSDPD